MEIIAKIVNFMLAMAAVIIFLGGPLSSSPVKEYMFITGMSLFVLASFMHVLTLTYYGR